MQAESALGKYDVETVIRESKGRPDIKLYVLTSRPGVETFVSLVEYMDFPPRLPHYNEAFNVDVRERFGLTFMEVRVPFFYKPRLLKIAGYKGYDIVDGVPKLYNSGLGETVFKYERGVTFTLEAASGRGAKYAEKGEAKKACIDDHQTRQCACCGITAMELLYTKGDRLMQCLSLIHI